MFEDSFSNLTSLGRIQAAEKITPALIELHISQTLCWLGLDHLVQQKDPHFFFLKVGILGGLWLHQQGGRWWQGRFAHLLPNVQTSTNMSCLKNIKFNQPVGTGQNMSTYCILTHEWVYCWVCSTTNGPGWSMNSSNFWAVQLGWTCFQVQNDEEDQSLLDPYKIAKDFGIFEVVESSDLITDARILFATSMPRKQDQTILFHFYLQPSAFRRPSSLLPVCRLQKAFVSKMSLCKSRACIKAMLV